MMDLEKFERDLRTYYKKSRAHSIEKKVNSLLNNVEAEWKLQPDNMTLHELKILASTIIELETHKLSEDVEELLAQKERIERQLERKSDELQDAKYAIFDAIEGSLTECSPQTLSSIHQIKLQSIDLFDMLEEMIESAIITTLEKGHDIEETIEEITKEITYETLSEGTLNAIRIRKIISTILETAINVAEASPNKAKEVLRATLRGIRAGLIKAMERFKRQLLYMPDEAKMLLIEDYAHLEEELHQTDALFEQTILTLANQSSPTTRDLLEEINNDIRFDMQELVHISKETVGIMRERLSAVAKEAVERSSKVLQSNTAKEAKRMGVNAWSAAKTAIDSAIKSYKEKK